VGVFFEAEKPVPFSLPVVLSATTPHSVVPLRSTTSLRGNRYHHGYDSSPVHLIKKTITPKSTLGFRKTEFTFS